MYWGTPSASTDLGTLGTEFKNDFMHFFKSCCLKASTYGGGAERLELETSLSSSVCHSRVVICTTEKFFQWNTTFTKSCGQLIAELYCPDRVDFQN